MPPFYFEASLVENERENSYCHLYFTNNTTRHLKESFDIKRFNINTWANFPLDDQSYIDLRLFTNKTNEIL